MAGRTPNGTRTRISIHRCCVRRRCGSSWWATKCWRRRSATSRRRRLPSGCGRSSGESVFLLGGKARQAPGNEGLPQRNAARLEVEAQRHLNDSRIVYYGADFAKCGGSAAKVDARVVEIHIVGQIVRFRAEREVFALHQLEALHQGSVDVEEAGAPESVAPGAADIARNGLGEVGYLGGREVIHARSNAVVAGHNAADVARTGIVGPGARRARTGGPAGADGEGRSALPNPQAAQIPAAQQRIGPFRHAAAEHVAFTDGQRGL